MKRLPLKVFVLSKNGGYNICHTKNTKNLKFIEISPNFMEL